MPQHPSSTTTIHLNQPPSCLQFCPASPNNFVVGTYLLSETKTTDKDGSETIRQSKTGSLQLWHLDPETDALTQKSVYPINAAVFDLHFHPRQDNILAIATSNASISLFSVSPETETGFTNLWTQSVHEDPSVPALFLAWLPENWLNPKGAGASSDGFAVTFSDGRTGVFSLTGNQDEPVTELGSFEAKQPIEVWFAAAASYLNSSAAEKVYTYTPYLFTGNDFGSLHTRRFADIQTPSNQTPPDTKEEEEEEEEEEKYSLPPTLISTDDKALHHTAGVTSILPLPIPLSHSAAKGEPLLLTGSYDEHLRVYHACRGGRGEVVAEMGLGGGVWRLQLLSTHTSTAKEEWTFLVLASCMHGGTRIVRVTVPGEGEAGIGILAEFTEHESMNYASDVWKGDVGSGIRVVSSSFYDRRVCVWRVEV